jgi:uncharacterized protein YprB with RNaseH-like and TPR domain
LLSRTFIHIPGVGPVTERRIWESGVLSWREFMREPGAAGLPAAIRGKAESAIAASLQHLEAENHGYFASALASREHWRAYPEFSHRVAYLDIETTGMGQEDSVTMVGVYDGRDVRIYTKGEDLQEFADDIRDYGLLVTFFGSCFDLPFLRRRFLDLRFDQLHIDLCHVLRRLGLKGGLKNIERQLSIPRSPETEGLDGWDAVRLWREWERGSSEALELLKAYNREDIVNLERLMHYAYEQMCEKTGIPARAV